MRTRRSGAAPASCARAVAALAVLLYAVVLLSAGSLPPGLTLAVDDLGQLLAAVAATGCCALAAARSALRQARRAWTLLACGTGAWAAGQAVWSWFELLSGREVPFPSPADAGFLAFPVLAAAGLLALPAGREAAGGRLRDRDLLDGLVAAGALLILSYESSLGAAVAGGGGRGLATVLSVAYPLGDVVVLTLVLLLLARVTTVRRDVLVPLAAGLAALAIADSSFLYLTAKGSYASGDLCGVGWTAGFALIAAGALAAAGSEDPGSGGPSGEQACVAGEALPGRVRLLVPYLPLVPAQAVVAVQLLTGDRRAPAFEVALALLLMGLVLVRQYLTLVDNRGLLLALQAQRETARHAALHDPLTGLANRTLFADRVAHALTLRTLGRPSSTVTTVLFCDLDDFKTVNDDLGHAAGDAVLVAVAERLRDCLRPADTIARLGGDEFAVLIAGGFHAGAETPEDIAGRLVAALGVPVAVAGRQVAVSVSVGLASVGSLVPHPMVPAELLRRADVAMYAAKASGKATWVGYDPLRHGPPRDPAALPVARRAAPVAGSGPPVGVPGGRA